jgi:hypothetical protein
MAAHGLPATADRVGGRLAMVDHTVRPAMVVADIPVRRVVDILRAVGADIPLGAAVGTPAVAADIPVAVITNTRGELMYELM